MTQQRVTDSAVKLRGSTEKARASWGLTGAGPPTALQGPVKISALGLRDTEPLEGATQRREVS